MDTKLKKHSAWKLLIAFVVAASAFCTAFFAAIEFGFISTVFFWLFPSMSSIVLSGVMGSSLVVLLIVFAKRKSMAIAKKELARVSGHIIMEIKLALSVLAVIGLGASFLDLAGYFDLGLVVIFLLSAWWIWLMLTDLRFNGKTFFKHNIFTVLMRIKKSVESKQPFLARMKGRLLVLIGAGVGFFVMGLLLTVALQGFGLFLFVLLAILWVIFLVYYVVEYFNNINELSLLIGYVEDMRVGQAKKPLELRGDFAKLGEDLSRIRSGIDEAVENRVRSERMKIELVTNVSHDLKTPLTSIINYIDLLSQEEVQPEVARDYIRVLEKKSQRLKKLVDDLFEVSKANSGSITIHNEDLDIEALLQQTIAEMDEQIAQEGIQMKTSFAAKRVLVYADGQKLHRVFENLLGNAIKYSLKGTRVYIEVRLHENDVEIVFKNISNYEMKFTARDIVERFTRGDVSRSTEGSGLGLSIVDSFVTLCGGDFHVELDGDLFKAVVRLPVSDEMEISSDENAAPLLDVAHQQGYPLGDAENMAVNSFSEIAEVTKREVAIPQVIGMRKPGQARDWPETKTALRINQAQKEPEYAENPPEEFVQQAEEPDQIETAPQTQMQDAE